MRFNVRRGGSADLAALDRLPRRVHNVAGWHAELYIESRDLADLYPVLSRLPAVSIDHLGLSTVGFDDLLRLVETGAYVKATGFGRIELDPAEAMTRILAVNPGALMFGTDLPSTRAPRPFADTDLWALGELIDPDHLRKVLWDNAISLYRV